jgi:hypothetical protein
MTNPTLERELHQHLDRLSAEDQLQVLYLARSLAGSKAIGVPGKELLRFAGLIPKEDLEEMKQAIEEDCGRIDPDGW